MNTSLQHFFRLLLLLLPFWLCQCRHSAPAAAAPGELQGYASYIDNRFAGRRTVMGDSYDPGRMTAASNHLPLGSTARVRNLNTGQVAEVYINDRFPNYPDRVINVSAAAANALGMAPYSLAPVSVSGQTQAYSSAPVSYGRRALVPAYSGAPGVAQGYVRPYGNAPMPPTFAQGYAPAYGY
jgi:rare lipoprotein A (peptidoglycan hydrolase)